ncbi:MAG: hypothetical protein KDC79_06750 [Cyclobacteriaceae bacterium]|nr:hypothetical protein [Cyclobacteriaceae bacterium]
MKNTNFLIPASLIFLSSCYYDNYESLYPDANLACDTTNVTFTNLVSPIVNESCATSGCHVQGTGRVLLTDYSSIKAAIDNGTFQQRALINKDMPPSGPLGSCDIKKIEAWISNGAQNN